MNTTLFKKLTIITVLISVFMHPLLITNYAFAQNPRDIVCDELSNVDAGSCATDSVGIFNSVVLPVIQMLIYIIGAIAVFVIVIAGLLYILSAGDANNAKRAKDALLYAVIGLVVAILAQAIVTFVIGAFV